MWSFTTPGNGFGPAEAFTPKQLAELCDVNVLSTQRVNRAALPRLRKQRKGLVVWVSSSSSAGGTPPYLALYFAANAGMDALAVIYARELTRWGIETSIIVPGAFTGGTNHFAHAGSPADKARLAEYDAGPYAGIEEQIMKGFASIVPADAHVASVAGVMTEPPRPRGEGVITRSMWTGIFFNGVIMAAGTLLTLGASLPGGLIEGAGNMGYAQTMTFTTLMIFQIFNLFNARSDEQSAFIGLFRNHWLWGPVLLSLLLQIAVIYIPFLQQAFSTVSLSFSDWLRCAAVASSVLWLRELSKAITRTRNRKVVTCLVGN
jgi:hypothetical protein